MRASTARLEFTKHLDGASAVRYLSRSALAEGNLEMYSRFIGQYVTAWCGVYIYHGRLEEIVDGIARLSDAKVVYETGPLTTTGPWRDAQSLPGDWHINLASVESFGILK
jgi:hypothetical protein